MELATGDPCSGQESHEVTNTRDKETLERHRKLV